MKIYKSFLKGIKLELALFETYHFVIFNFRAFGYGIRFKIER